jgi:hypothetical protein
MPSELQRVAQELLATLDEIPRVVGYLHDHAQKYREAAGWVGSTSGNPSARMAAMQLDEAARRCEEAAHYLSLAPPRARAWVEQMVSGVRLAEPSSNQSTRPGGEGSSPQPAGSRRRDGSDVPGSSKPDPTAGPADDSSPESDPPQLSDEDAGELLRKLPVRRNHPGHREKTRGLWKDSDGTDHEWVSGFDDWRDQADRFAVAEKLGDAPHLLQITSHVEIKFAMFMRQRGLRRASLVVNHPPCLGDSGCDAMLSDFLPKGAKLTVYGPENFKETYPKQPKSDRTDEA